MPEESKMKGSARHTYMAIAMIGYIKAVIEGTPPKLLEGVRKGAIQFFASALSVMEAFFLKSWGFSAS